AESMTAAVSAADTSASLGFLPEGAPAPTRALADGPTGFDYPTTYVGTVGKIAVYYATSLGADGQAQAQGLLGRVAGPYADMESIFATTGGATNVILAPLSAAHDGSGGAYHWGCDFATGGTLYVDATFANTTVDPLSWAVGLYIAELSEAFMGQQGKGW